MDKDETWGGVRIKNTLKDSIVKIVSENDNSFTNISDFVEDAVRQSLRACGVKI